MFRATHFLTATACAFALAAISCIERSNPFDPINGGPEAAADIRKQNQPALDTLAAGEPMFAAFLDSLAVRMREDSLDRAKAMAANASRRAANEGVKASNAAAAEANRNQAAIDSLRLLAYYALLDTLKAYGPYPGFADRRAALRDQASALSGHLAGINARKFPLVVYGAAFMDSVLKPFVRDSLAFARAQAAMDAASAAAADSNAAFRAYNLARAADNAAVRAYNDSIDFLKRTRNVNVITRSDSLQNIASAAKAGDSLYLGPGVFTVDLRFNHSGSLDSPIVIRGYPGRATILRPAPGAGGSNNAMVITKDRKYIRFENLVFRGGVEGSAKLEGNASDISFRNCLFDSSQGPGLEAYDSDLEMTDCEVRANRGPGVRVGGGAAPGLRMRFTNVLIVRNGGAGLEGTSQFLELKKCTLADNGGDGLHIISPLQPINIANTLIAGNLGFGINRQATASNQDLLSVGESDLFGNASGNWSLPAMDSVRADKLIKANLNVNPEFIDAAAFDYAPRPGSALDAYEKQALLVIIGYRKPSP
jgi:hypothetical protein